VGQGMSTPENDTSMNPALRFMVDHMVIKLGKHSRILGFDADWDLPIRTHELIVRANREHRVFLTRNTKLLDEYPAVDHVFWLDTTHPVEQLQRVIAAYDIDPHARMFTRCIRCNVELLPVEDKATIRQHVHPNVYKRHDQFFTCPNCGTVFWKGTHVANTCRKLDLETP